MVCPESGQQLPEFAASKVKATSMRTPPGLPPGGGDRDQGPESRRPPTPRPSPRGKKATSEDISIKVSSVDPVRRGCHMPVVDPDQRRLMSFDSDSCLSGNLCPSWEAFLGVRQVKGGSDRSPK